MSSAEAAAADALAAADVAEVAVAAEVAAAEAEAAAAELAAAEAAEAAEAAGTAVAAVAAAAAEVAAAAAAEAADVAAAEAAEAAAAVEAKIPVPGEMSCTVSVNANNGITVSYSDFPNVSSVNILRNSRWIANDRSATPGTGTYDDTTAEVGVAYSYVIRSRPGGVVTDFACSPATITIVVDEAN